MFQHKLICEIKYFFYICGMNRLLFILILFVSDFCFSQEINFCGTHDFDKNKLCSHHNRENYEWNDITVSLIVHVLHNGEPYGEGLNISDEQIKNSIDELNISFSGARDFFMPDSKFRFCISNYDFPFDNNYGIIRHDLNDFEWFDGWDGITEFNDVFEFAMTTHNSIVGEDPFYCHVFIGEWPTGLSGFTMGPIVDWSVWCKTNKFISEFGDSDYGTLEHEMGHWLGLLHVDYMHPDCESAYNESDCENMGDFVCDTPPTPSYGCGNDCDIDSTSVLISNFMNFCSSVDATLFTVGQIDRMQTQVQWLRPEIVSNYCACGIISECKIDLNNDGVVQVQDLLILLSNMYTNNDCTNGDLNNDNIINTIDLLNFMSYYTYDCNTGQIYIQ